MDSASPSTHGRVGPWAAGVAFLAGSAVVLPVAVPSLRLAYRSLPLQASFETAVALVALLATHLFIGRFSRTCNRRDLLLATGLALLAAGNLLFGVVPDVAGGRDAALAGWAHPVVTLLASLLLAASVLLPQADVRVQRPRRWPAAVAVLVALGVAAALVALVDPAPPVDASRSPADSSLLEGNSLMLAFQLTAGLGFGAAALGLGRLARRTGDELLAWFSMAAVLAAAARIDYFLWPASYVSWFGIGDLLRIGSYLLLLAGEVREIADYQRERAAAARAEERRHVARELHDGFAQELAFISTVGDRLVAGEGGREDLLALRRAAGRAANESRVLIDALRDPEDQPLTAALVHAAGELAKRAGADLTVRVDDGLALPPAVRQTVLRVVQEAVNNAVKHGEASAVEVQVTATDGTRLRVADDGRGFRPEAAPHGAGFGLRGMQERVDALGGRLRVRSQPGAGTEVLVVLPS